MFTSRPLFFCNTACDKALNRLLCQELSDPKMVTVHHAAGCCPWEGSKHKITLCPPTQQHVVSELINYHSLIKGCHGKESKELHTSPPVLKSLWLINFVRRGSRLIWFGCPWLSRVHLLVLPVLSCSKFIHWRQKPIEEMFLNVWFQYELEGSAV